MIQKKLDQNIMICLCKNDFYEFVIKVLSEENDKLGLVPTPKLEEARKMILKDLCKKVEKKYERRI